MATETLEERADLYSRDLIDAVRLRPSYLGSILSIGDHVYDKASRFTDQGYQNRDKAVPADAIFEISEGDSTRYGKVDDKKLEKSLGGSISEDWFQKAGKVPLSYHSEIQPEDYQRRKSEGKVLGVEVDRIDTGGSAGNCAVGMRAFLDLMIYMAGQSEHPDAKHVVEDLSRVNVYYSAIDSDSNGREGHYNSFGIMTKGRKNGLLVKPEGYKVPSNYIFETGVKTILMSPKMDVLGDDGSFADVLSRTNFNDLGMLAMVSPKHPYLMQEGFKLVGDKNVLYAGAFSSSSLAANRDGIMHRLAPSCDIIVENRDEIADMMKTGMYEGIDLLAGRNRQRELTIYVSRDSEGIMGFVFRNGMPIAEVYANPYGLNLKAHDLDHKPEFTGAGDTAMGAALVSSHLGLDMKHALELSNLMASYRISHQGNHTYARELQEEIASGSPLSIMKYSIDPARENPLRR